MYQALKGLSSLIIACCGLFWAALIPALMNSDFAGLAHLCFLFLFLLPILFLVLLGMSIAYAASKQELPYPAAWCFAAVLSFMITAFGAGVIIPN